ncbi:GNAT family N-acetyltransferase [Streptomyces sannanensis]|uniref:GNAT family N-acetyltransferase n=1 Tax=Streptomyces sannanensis TaxID=285536 RepID=A0ABP6S869_9ACTN
MNDHRIRPATLADDAVLTELDAITWSPLFAVTPKPQPPYGPFFTERNPREEILVAESDDRSIAGYIRLGRPSPLASNAHVRQIQGLVVAEWARGLGTARALLRAAADEARRQGAIRIWLRVLAHNTPARKLYESEGYAVEGILPGELLLDGEYVDDVLMGRSV